MKKRTLWVTVLPLFALGQEGWAVSAPLEPHAIIRNAGVSLSPNLPLLPDFLGTGADLEKSTWLLLGLGFLGMLGLMKKRVGH